MNQRLTLVVVGEERAPVELPQQGKLVIGSGDRAHVEIRGQGVADVHCTIGRVKGGGWALKDLGSEFGTLVNGSPVNASRLSAGDELTIGSRRLRVVDPVRGDAPPEAPAPPPAAAPAKAPAPQPTAPSAAAPEPAPTSAKAIPKQRVDPNADDGAPVLGGYRVQDRLGRGAMGAVYLANQTSLDRPVALKVMKPKLAADPRFVERFQAEARAAAALNHPNVVTVFDVGSDGPHHYLSMEYMDGGSLEARLEREGPLPWREVLGILSDSAAGLEYAEARGIVHRDVKPENLMQNRDGVTKLADLGLAVQVEAEEHLAGGEGQKIFGTPHFIAPEVVRGQPATSRSDLYSLGATAYRLLSGHTPFEGESTREILRGLLGEEAPPLADRVPGLPTDVAAVVHRLLEKDPDDRYLSAKILRDELERLRRGETPAAAVEPSGGLPRGALIGGGVAVLLALAFVGKGLLGGGEDPEPGRGTTTVGGAESAGNPSTPGETSKPTENTTPSGSSTSSTEGDGTATGGGDEPEGPSEELVEARARIALLELRDQVLDDAEKSRRLRQLAQEYAGTDTAAAALADAETIDQARAAALAVEQAEAAERKTVLDALRVASTLDAESPDLPGASLRAMRLVAGLAEQLDDTQFIAQRDAVVAEVLARGVTLARDGLARADAAEAAGDFDALGQELRAILPLGDLPPPAEVAPLFARDLAELQAPEGAAPTAPSDYGVLEGLVETARTRLGGIAGQREELAERRAAEARAAVAGALKGGQGLESDLHRFELGTVARRFRVAAAAALDGGPELTTLAEDAEAAASVLRALGESWDAPGWKRVSFLDPRADGRRASLEAVGADAEGVLVRGDGELERLTWGEWASHPRALENLVNARLERDWSPDELRGCTFLLRVASVLAAIAEAEEVLVANSESRFSPGEAKKLLEAYDDLDEWVRSTGVGRAVAQAERRAAEKLSAALLARTEGEWSRAAEQLERLLQDHPDTLLVRLLSDGSAEQ